MVRRADHDILATVKHSETLKRVNRLDMMSISPTLIFFEHDLSEDEISNCVKRLHGDNIKKQYHNYMLNLREVNDILQGAQPNISLMFCRSSSQYAHTKIPGFLNVPCNFKVNELLTYTKENIGECRAQALKHLEEERTKQKINFHN
jgi:hypothetical protein